MNEYMAYCFKNQDSVLKLTNVSRQNFEIEWSAQIEQVFGYAKDTIAALYNRDSDVHKSEDKTRAIWKYGAARGVSGTPTAFINGA